MPASRVGPARLKQPTSYGAVSGERCDAWRERDGEQVLRRVEQTASLCCGAVLWSAVRHTDSECAALRASLSVWDDSEMH